MLTAREIMSQNPVTVPPTAKLRQAVQILQMMDIRHLPVVTEEGELVGMVSDRDLRALSIPYLVGGEYAGNLQTAGEASVASLMSSDVLAVEPECDVSEIVELMLDQKVGAVPVTEADGTLVGIVSYVDLLRELQREAEEGS